MTEPERPLVPDYGRRSLAELTPSLMAALGVPGSANPLGIHPVDRVCLLLIDGLGVRQLVAHAADAPFLSALATGPRGTVLTAGFPASTPVSLASLGTGAPPGGHGVLGLSFDPGHGELLDTLTWSARRGGRAVDLREELPPERVQPLATTLQRAQAAGTAVTVVSPREFKGSGLTRAALRGGTYRGVYALGDLAATLVTALREPGFCYGYHADLDALGHLCGPGSPAWRMQLAVIDRVTSLVAEALPPGGLLAVTADHGMVDVPEGQKVDFDAEPALRAGVRLLAGDGRSRHVYAEPGAAGDVLAAWRERLADRAWVLARDEAVAQGWFGPVRAREVAARIGDVVVAMRGGAAVVRTKAEPLLATLVGNHGSLTAAEQEVPQGRSKIIRSA